MTILAVAWCIVASAFLFADLGRTFVGMLSSQDLAGASVHGSFMIIILVLQFSAFIYLITRLAQLNRHGAHRSAADDELEDVYGNPEPPVLAALVPSYKEDVRVIRRTLLSAALLDYPNRRVVLLIDNPPHDLDPDDLHLLHRTRRLAGELDELLAELDRPFAAALEGFLTRQACRKQSTAGRLAAGEVEDELNRLAALYETAATTLCRIEAAFPPADHEDRGFVERSLRRPVMAHRARAARLRAAAADPARQSGWVPRMEREYRRLSCLFNTSIGSFERKRYDNLSHAPNKAMNLNSYLALMGKAVREVREGQRLLLRETPECCGGQRVPDADFIITLDADSVLDPCYALKLVRFMRQPGNERVGVVQTPYAAFPGAPGALERVAGATTDIQYLIHQGFTRYNATFWVGANALLRKRALEDIASPSMERGHPVTRYIQDNTVIEDTESSVDLVARDWRLHNYAERLAWSATPPDFGSLLIQRRRWANGGLIILPKFLRYVLRRRRVPHRLGHAAMGWHYLTSLATTNVGIVALLVLPVETGMRSWWLPTALLAYMALYARDLVRMGYRAVDVANVYALTLVLVPVHLGGVAKSLQQIFTGNRTPFGRTPKVQNRTAVPLLYIVGIYGLLAVCICLLGRDVSQGLMLHSVFILVNAGFLMYAVVRFLGLRESLADLRASVKTTAGWLTLNRPETQSLNEPKTTV